MDRLESMRQGAALAVMLYESEIGTVTPLPVVYAMQRFLSGEYSQADLDLVTAWYDLLADE